MKTQDTIGHQIELIEYCDECGTHHAENECPMRFESGYELAHQERILQAEGDVWFTG